MLYANTVASGCRAAPWSLSVVSLLLPSIRPFLNKSAIFPIRSPCRSLHFSTSPLHHHQNANAVNQPVAPKGQDLDQQQSSFPSSVLFLSNVFPDPSASAAGTRTQSLVKGWAPPISKSMHFVTSQDLPSSQQQPNAAANPHAIIRSLQDDHGVSWSHLPPNRAQAMEAFCLQGQPYHPDENPLDMVVFDRFYMEEAYSFALRQHYPDAMLVLDMQDMHSLRGYREQVVRDWDKTTREAAQSKENKNDHDPLQVLPLVMGDIPCIVQHDLLLRELAAIQRSDLTLVCSPVEKRLLEEHYQIPSSKLCLASFFVPIHPLSLHADLATSPAASPQEPSFVFCGGFKHPPNVDAVRLLLDILWPKIRQQLPNAQLHIYGAYCPSHFKARTSRKHGIQVHGFAPDLDSIFQPGRIVLAPLRFGAGIKGKIVDAWTYGLPVVTTPVGAEGMTVAIDGDSSSQESVSSTPSFGGAVTWTSEDFVEAAVTLATDETNFRKAATAGHQILTELYHDKQNWNDLDTTVRNVWSHLNERRSTDVSRAVLWHQSARSTEYFSRWIELKESLK